MQSTLRYSYSRTLWTLLFTTLACLFVIAGPVHAELAIHVRGNQLINEEGRSIRLLGVNFSGAEYACIQDRGIWSAPTDKAAIEAMTEWHIDVVRIPLNEDCWLAINGAPAEYSGAPYQQAVHEYVKALHEAGLYTILDLQWSAPGANQATGLQQMADADHSPDFWRSVAQSFREDPAVLFDLYSEPHEISWECWLEGCTLPWSGGGTWQTAGMQTLVDAVRSQGATQPLLVGGIEWANDLSEWLAHLPNDPQNQLVASVHVYPNNTCNSSSCWSKTLAPITSHYPVVAGETGEFDCEDHFVDQFMNWSDANDVSYLGWTWNTFDCSSGPALIANTDGTPTEFGEGLHDRLRTPRMTLTASPSPAIAGKPVSLTVQVASPTATASPSGDITFQVDGENLASQPLDSSGQTVLSLPQLSVGTHKVHALYAGDETLEPSATSTQTVSILAEVTPPLPPLPPTSPPAPAQPPATPSTSLTAPPPVAVLPPPQVGQAQADAAPGRVIIAGPSEHASSHQRRPAISRQLCSRASRARTRGARGRQLRAHCPPIKHHALPSRNETTTRKG